mgnify:CR=1 FL=1
MTGAIMALEALALGERPSGRTALRARWIVGHGQGGHRLFENAEVVIEGQRVLYVGPGFPGEVARRIDLGEALVSPGFVDLDAGDGVALDGTRVALASGFGSLRRFNAAFAAHYGLNPTALRREGRAHEGQGVTVRLGYRPPYDVDALLAFFARRSIDSVEFASAGAADALLGRTLRLRTGGRSHTGWLTARFDPDRPAVVLQVSDSLSEVLPLVLAKARAWLDLDADPVVIQACLSPEIRHEAGAPGGDLAGLRVPGCLDGFELGVRAILGQQVTVAAARSHSLAPVSSSRSSPTPAPGDAHVAACGRRNVVANRRRHARDIATQAARLRARIGDSDGATVYRRPHGTVPAGTCPCHDRTQA